MSLLLCFEFACQRHHKHCGSMALPSKVCMSKHLSKLFNRYMLVTSLQRKLHFIMSLSLCKIMKTLWCSDWSPLSVGYSPATANLCFSLVNIINTYSKAYIFSDKTPSKCTECCWRVQCSSCRVCNCNRSVHVENIFAAINI